MREHVCVEVVDEERAVRDALADEGADSRDEFLKRAALAGGAIAVGGVVIAGLPRLALSAPSPAQDAEILNFALLLEELLVAFYSEAGERASLAGELSEFVATVAGQEQAHVDLLRQTLGEAAAEAPTFDVGNATGNPERVAATAVTLEDVGVAAYNGQGPNLTREALAAAARIVSVHARHAAWIRSIVGKTPAAQATDKPMTKAQVEAALQAAGFLPAR
jgi:Ferritin-like domain